MVQVYGEFAISVGVANHRQILDVSVPVRTRAECRCKSYPFNWIEVVVGIVKGECGFCFQFEEFVFVLVHVSGIERATETDVLGDAEGQVCTVDDFVAFF